MSAPEIQVFVNEKPDTGEESIAILIRAASVVDYEDELVPGCLLTPSQAMYLAGALAACAQEIEGTP
jgi:hypothetical protein